MPTIASSARDAFYEARPSDLAARRPQALGQRGFAQTSVETIARKAGTAKGTPYLDFDSKGALLLS